MNIICGIRSFKIKNKIFFEKKSVMKLVARISTDYK